MTNDDSAPVNRPLNDDERHMLNELVVWKIRHGIAANSGVHVDQDSTIDALDDLIEKHGMALQYGERQVYVTVGERRNIILRVSREFLAFHSQHDEQVTEDQLAAALASGDIE
ncbi:hypothetical protein MHPYR_490044 [uncultured Mycobacterium sp.]|uniref:Uncharacterized protein n=1 Tax=uncultured Mycobacterium sp. TaxID=171292 RepID=A0A1Y5PNW2_9MYCO|nr:hypothetical protein MHPYR_490044 [uncultured Mycobacterium sp.]